jgi:hypothetical protein
VRVEPFDQSGNAGYEGFLRASDGPGRVLSVGECVEVDAFGWV